MLDAVVPGHPPPAVGRVRVRPAAEKPTTRRRRMNSGAAPRNFAFSAPYTLVKM